MAMSSDATATPTTFRNEMSSKASFKLRMMSLSKQCLMFRVRREDRMTEIREKSH
jgi:hypothetical protein